MRRLRRLGSTGDLRASDPALRHVREQSQHAHSLDMDLATDAGGGGDATASGGGGGGKDLRIVLPPTADGVAASMPLSPSALGLATSRRLPMIPPHARSMPDDVVIKPDVTSASESAPTESEASSASAAATQRQVMLSSAAADKHRQLFRKRAAESGSGQHGGLSSAGSQLSSARDAKAFAVPSTPFSTARSMETNESLAHKRRKLVDPRNDVTPPNAAVKPEVTVKTKRLFQSHATSVDSSSADTTKPVHHTSEAKTLTDTSTDTTSVTLPPQSKRDDTSGRSSDTAHALALPSQQKDSVNSSSADTTTTVTSSTSVPSTSDVTVSSDLPVNKSTSGSETSSTREPSHHGAPLDEVHSSSVASQSQASAGVDDSHSRDSTQDTAAEQTGMVAAEMATRGRLTKQSRSDTLESDGSVELSQSLLDSLDDRESGGGGDAQTIGAEGATTNSSDVGGASETGINSNRKVNNDVVVDIHAGGPASIPTSKHGNSRDGTNGKNVSVQETTVAAEGKESEVEGTMGVGSDRGQSTKLHGIAVKEVEKTSHVGAKSKDTVCSTT